LIEKSLELTSVRFNRGWIL